jgi:hypothetical protein
MDTTTAPAVHQPILDALGNLHDERDRWTLAEVLNTEAPQHAGNVWFQNVVDAADSAGVPSLSVTSLRQYRDTAARWPADKRVAGASFTAHREVQTLGIEAGADLLRDLVGQHGAKGVTTTLVRKAIMAKQGTTAAAKKAAPASVSFTDLLNGAPKLIAVIKAAGLDASALDKLHAGVSAVLAEVDGQRMRAARKGAKGARSAKPAARPAVQAVPPLAETEAVPAAANGAAGDLRGL